MCWLKNGWSAVWKTDIYSRLGFGPMLKGRLTAYGYMSQHMQTCMCWQCFANNTLLYLFMPATGGSAPHLPGTHSHGCNQWSSAVSVAGSSNTSEHIKLRANIDNIAHHSTTLRNLSKIILCHTWFAQKKLNLWYEQSQNNWDMQPALTSHYSEQLSKASGGRCLDAGNIRVMSWHVATLGPKPGASCPVSVWHP